MEETEGHFGIGDGEETEGHCYREWRRDRKTERQTDRHFVIGVERRHRDTLLQGMKRRQRDTLP